MPHFASFLIGIYVIVSTSFESVNAQCCFNDAGDGGCLKCHCAGGNTCNNVTGECPQPGCDPGPSNFSGKYQWSGPACQIGNVGYMQGIAKQSVTRPSGRFAADEAIDGFPGFSFGTDKSDHCSKPYLYNTPVNGPKVWWLLDLQADFIVQKIYLHNSFSQSEAENMRDFKVSVYDRDGTETCVAEQNATDVAALDAWEMTCNNTPGKEIYVEKTNSATQGVMALCEVVVIGYDARFDSCQTTSTGIPSSESPSTTLTESMTTSTEGLLTRPTETLSATPTYAATDSKVATRIQTESPSPASTQVPTSQTESPSTASTETPATSQTERPSTASTEIPTTSQTESPSTEIPTSQTESPSTEIPTTSQTESPSTEIPTTSQTESPSIEIPTTSQNESLSTEIPTTSQTESPSIEIPTTSQTESPPTEIPTTSQTESPSTVSTEIPSTIQTGSLSTVSTEIPSNTKTDNHSTTPTREPSTISPESPSFLSARVASSTPPATLSTAPPTPPRSSGIQTTLTPGTQSVEAVTVADTTGESVPQGGGLPPWAYALIAIGCLVLAIALGLTVTSIIALNRKKKYAESLAQSNKSGSRLHQQPIEGFYPTTGPYSSLPVRSTYSPRHTVPDLSSADGYTAEDFPFGYYD